MTNVLIGIHSEGGQTKNYYTIRAIDGLQTMLSNRRLVLSLEDYGYIYKNETILIPFTPKRATVVLHQLQATLKRFGVSQQLSSAIQEKEKSYYKEQALFEEFAQNARSIRNDEFHQYPTLIDDFKKFQDVVNQTLERKLYDLQLLSSFHMAFAQNVCNFAVPGAGKTSIVYAAYAYLKQLPKNHPKHVNKLLVIGPLSSFAPWEQEYAACFGKKVKSKRLGGDPSLDTRTKENYFYGGYPEELTLLFYAGASNLQEAIIDCLKRNPTMVVVDEAHRIKNPDGIWGRSVIEIAKEAKARIVLTGTPLPNGYEDLYNLYQFIYPFKFQSILKMHYPNLIDMTKHNSPESGRVQDLTNNIAPFFIRIKKKDLSLPPLKEEDVKVEMNTRQREIYDFIESKYIASFKKNPRGSVKDILNRAKLIRLRQASTNPALLSKPLKDALIDYPDQGEVDPNAKYTNYSDEFVDDADFFHRILNYAAHENPEKFIATQKIVKKIIDQRQKVIVWTIFIQNAKDLQAYLRKRGISSRLLIGATPQEEREATIATFNNPQNLDFQVIIANPFAVAESISLHKGCHNAIYLERDYNCAIFLQSKDRIHRVGLPKDQLTTYYYIISRDSIDSVINEKLQVKIKRMEKIIDDDIPLFNRLEDSDETDIVQALIRDYAQRT